MKHYLNPGFWLAMAVFVGTCQAQELGYEVSGYSGNVYVYGELVGHVDDIEVEGYLFDPNGKAAYFTGEWIGNGQFEGYDEDDNFYRLEMQLDDEFEDS